ncbi:MAG: CapA family protein, partial [Clostridia bacterium]|nr:CapA family protein [Clostridia bacterium]
FYAELTGLMEEMKQAGAEATILFIHWGNEYQLRESETQREMAQRICDLGVDVIVHGGQTKNPSIQDFLDAFDQVPAEHIFVFPNNGNILLAAQQAAEIYQEDHFNPVAVHVIESKDLGSGYVALASMDISVENPLDLKKQLETAMKHVATGCVSPAVRDAQLNGVEIHNGDYIGFVGKEMLVSESCAAEAAQGLLKHMLADGSYYVVTAFVGQDANPEQAQAVEAFVREQYPDVELYLTDGDQEVYPFIFVAE